MGLRGRKLDPTGLPARDGIEPACKPLWPNTEKLAGHLSEPGRPEEWDGQPYHYYEYYQCCGTTRLCILILGNSPIVCTSAAARRRGPFGLP